MKIHWSPRACIAACVSLLLALAAPSAAATQSLAENIHCDPAQPRRVAIAGGRVSLVLPEGMDRATDAVLARRFGTGPFPELVAANDAALIFVRVVDEEARVDSPDYQATRVRIAETLSPGFGQWVAREVVEQDGVRWLVHEYTARTGGATEHHRRYLAAFEGRTLEAAFVNVTSQAEWGAEMDYAAASLVLGDCAAALGSDGALAGAAGPAAASASQRPSVPDADAGVCEEWKLREEVRAGDPRRWVLLDGRLTLAPVEEGTLTPAAILRTSPEEPPLRVGMGDSARVAFEYLPEVAMIDSASFQRNLERRIAGASPPNVRWISRGVVEQGGTRWLRMVYMDRPPGAGETYRVVHVAPLQGRTLAAVFTGLPGQANAIDQAAATLALRDCEVTRPLDAWVDSAGLARAAAQLPPLALPLGVKPVFRVGFDTAGALQAMDPVFDQIPAEYVAAATAAIRANLKAQPGWYDWTSYYVRVAGGPAPVVDRPEVTTRPPVLRNRDWVMARLSDVAGDLALRPGARRQAADGIYVDMRVSSTGEVDVETLRVVHSSGVASVDNTLLGIARRMRFAPGEIDGIPAPVWIRVPLRPVD
jgi:hypothetical protein